MAERGTLDILARDPSLSAVLMLGFTPVHHGHGKLAGELRAHLDGVSEVAVEVIAHLETESDDLREEETDGGGLRLIDGSGHQVGREIRSYKRLEVVEGRYEIHSGVVDGDTDVFAVSDPIELAVAGLLVGACIFRTVLQHQRMRELAQIYQEQGRLPKFRMKSGLKGALTCDIEWEVEAGD